jgi:hypothetical protein
MQPGAPGVLRFGASGKENGGAKTAPPFRYCGTIPLRSIDSLAVGDQPGRLPISQRGWERVCGRDKDLRLNSVRPGGYRPALLGVARHIASGVGQ